MSFETMARASDDFSMSNLGEVVVETARLRRQKTGISYDVTWMVKSAERALLKGGKWTGRYVVDVIYDEFRKAEGRQ